MPFNAPIGSALERSTGIIWPGSWTDANVYLNHYSLGFHTGADLNLNFPNFDMDKHARVYAMGDGRVTYAHLYSATVWGNIIVIDHGIVDGRPLFSRYGHVENIQVADNEQVSAGQHIADVGNAEGLFPYHLHFDISTTDKLRTSASHWPGENQAAVELHYVNPKLWLQAHATATAAPPRRGRPSPAVTPTDYFVIASLGLRVRENHSTTARQVGILNFGDKVVIDDTKTEDQDGYTWAPIVSGPLAGNFIAMGPADRSEFYVSQTGPSG